MDRRRFLAGLACAGLVLASPAYAQDAQARILQRLQDDGYVNIRLSRTFLGRIRILASGTQGEREIVLNPSTGVVLRDYLRPPASDGDTHDRQDDDQDDADDHDASNDDDDTDDSDDASDDGNDGGNDDDDEDGGDDDDD